MQQHPPPLPCSKAMSLLLLVGASVVPEQTKDVSEEKSRSQRLGQGVSRIHDARDVDHAKDVLCTPFLHSKVLSINVTRPWSWLGFIDHVNGCLVVNEEFGGLFNDVPQLNQDRTKVLDELGREHSCNEFCLSATSSYYGLQLTLVCNYSSCKEQGKPSD